MRARAIVMCLCGVLAFETAGAAEGRVSALNGAAPERERVARYTGAEGKPDGTSGVPHSKPAAKTKGAAVAPEKRAAVVMQSHRESDFHILDAGSALLTDRDGDGFYREFR